MCGPSRNRPPAVLNTRAKKKGKQGQYQASILNQEPRVDIDQYETVRTAPAHTRARTQSLNEEDTSEQAVFQAAGKPVATWKRQQAALGGSNRRAALASMSLVNLGSTVYSAHYRGCVNSGQALKSLKELWYTRSGDCESLQRRLGANCAFQSGSDINAVSRSDWLAVTPALGGSLSHTAPALRSGLL